MFTAFEFGGNNPYNQDEKAMIVLKQSDDGLFHVIYGHANNTKASLNYDEAAKSLGYAIMHHLAGESLINNEGN